jgi:glycosyltransferase involved in cell wall biosynthesis
MELGIFAPNLGQLSLPAHRLLDREVAPGNMWQHVDERHKLDQSARDPLSCPHRCVWLNNDGHSKLVCKIAATFVKAIQSGHIGNFEVTDETCSACCKFSDVELPSLNPIVASIIYRELADGTPSDAQTPETYIRWKYAIEFCQTRFRLIEPDQSKLQPGLQPSLDSIVPQASASKRRFSVKSAVRKLLRYGTFDVGLAGIDSAFGLGHANRDLFRLASVRKWISPLNPNGAIGASNLPTDYASWNQDVHELMDWANGLDVILFVEQPPFLDLIEACKKIKIPVVCIANWEWIRPSLSWVRDVQMMICPTRYAFELLSQWKRQYRFAWQIEYWPWPIDTNRFRYVQRSQCNEFVSVVGNGGFGANDLTGNHPVVHRKGTQILLSAAKMLPECRFRIYTTQDSLNAPTNVEVFPYVPDNVDLYREGDVCVQCSYWEGCGLPLLECQASGMPLVTVDWPPMNEYETVARIPVCEGYIGSLGGSQLIPIPKIDPIQVANTLSSIYKCDISSASNRARTFIENQHDWLKSRYALQRMLKRLIRNYRLTTADALC